MGYVMAFAPCLVCKVPFGFNPNTVPSFRPKPGSAKEPICGGCMDMINAKRKERGMAPFPVAADAYDSAEECSLNG